MLITQRKYIVLFGAFAVQLSLGCFYSTGNIQGKIAKYVANKTNQSFNEIMKTSSWIFGAMSLGLGSSISFGGFMDNIIGTIGTVLVGGSLLCFNTAIMIVMLDLHLWLIIVTYGLLGGVGVGIAYGVILGFISKVFTERRGLIFGITLSGYGLSALIQDLLQHFFIQNDVHIKWIFGYIAIFCTVILLIGVILLGFKRKIQIELNHSSCGSAKYDIFNSHIRVQKEFKPHQILYEYDFWILWLIMTASSAVDNIVITFYNNYCHSHKINIFVISVAFSISNSVGRIFWGFLIDIKPFKFIMIILFGINSLFLATLPFLTKANVTELVFRLWYSVLGFQLGGSFVVFPTVCATLFGTDNFTMNYGMLFTSNSIPGCVICLVSMNYFSQTFFRNVCIVGSAISLFGAILVGLFRGKSLITHYVD